MKGLFAVPEEAVGPEAPEFFEGLIRGPDGLLLERIVSNGQVTPPGRWYDQERDEWVAVLRGSARIAYEDGEEVLLEQGDSLLLPAGKKHRVSYCSSPCVWLALHGRGLALHASEAYTSEVHASEPPAAKAHALEACAAVSVVAASGASTTDERKAEKTVPSLLT